MRKQEFTYSTITTEKKVVMGLHPIKQQFFVDVMDSISLASGSTNWYKTEKEAQKRFDSIKKRVSK